MNSILLSTVFVFFATSYHVETKDKKNAQYFDKFAAWHCYQKMTCTTGGGWVCGVDRTKDFVMASFPDKCHLHGVNCRKQGVYKLISTEKCNPTILFLKLVVKDYGQSNFVYSTLPYGYKDAALDDISMGKFAKRQMSNKYSTERFPLHRNWTKIGVYWQISTDDCYPIGIVYEKVYDYGEPQFLYSTLPVDNSTEPLAIRQLNNEYSTESLILRRNRTRIVAASIFTKMKDMFGVSANFSVDDG